MSFCSYIRVGYLDCGHPDDGRLWVYDNGEKICVDCMMEGYE
jgi:hypothetical protein